jgi:hypothetical protein
MRAREDAKLIISHLPRSLQFAATARPDDLLDETLNNVACVVLTLVRSTGDVVAEAKLVMKVAQSEGEEGVFTRSVFNPLVST